MSKAAKLGTGLGIFLLVLTVLFLAILPIGLVIWGIVNLVTAGVSVWNVGAIVVGGLILLTRIGTGSEK